MLFCAFLFLYLKAASKGKGLLRKDRPRRNDVVDALKALAVPAFLPVGPKAPCKDEAQRFRGANVLPLKKALKKDMNPYKRLKIKWVDISSHFTKVRR